MSMYEDIGGRAGLRLLSTAFYERVLADDLLAPVFVHFTPGHVEHVAVWLAEVFGGPADFSARLGGHQALLSSHLGLEIREEHRRRWLELMAEAITEVLPDRPLISDALMSYFAWGTAIAQHVSQSPVGTDLGEPGPVPRWDYDGLVEQ